MPLRISAKIPRDGSRYFREKIEPQLDEQIRYVGELKDPDKERFLGGATALLFPIEPEPFGLVMIEAMACGTPVIAFRRAVSEVAEHGASGFIVDDESEAIAALSRIDRLDRHQVRQAFERRFLTRRMTDDYLRIYRTLLNRGQDDLVPASAILQERDHLHADHVAYR
jgi:glycosyltransferase involved in cell wall biosynthesis